MTTYTTLSDTTLAQDKPFTQSTSRALRDNPIAISEGDATAPKIDPKALAAKQVIAYRSTDATYNAASSVAVVFDTETADVGGFYSSSNGKFQPTEPGLYRLSVHLKFGTVSSNGETYFYKNGSTNLGGSDNMVSNSEVDFSVLVSLNGSTDYVEVRLYNGNGNCVVKGTGSLAGTPRSFFSAYKVGAQ